MNTFILVKHKTEKVLNELLHLYHSGYASKYYLIIIVKVYLLSISNIQYRSMGSSVSIVTQGLRLKQELS